MPEAFLPLVAGAHSCCPLSSLLALRPGADQALCLARRLRAGGEELADDALDGAVEVIGHLADQPDLERRMCVEPLSGQEVAAGRAFADLREDEGRDHGGDDPELDLGEPEDRVLGSDRDVHGRGEPGTAAERVPLDPPDDRGGAPVDRLHHREEPHGVVDVLVEGEADRGPLPLDVGAGAEALAFACEQDDACISDIPERFVQVCDQLRVERVAAFRLSERHSQDRPLALHSQPRHRAGL